MQFIRRQSDWIKLRSLGSRTEKEYDLRKLKVAVLVPDGASDLPLKELGGMTPLEAAQTPNMDEVARLGSIGLLRTIPPGMSPGSDVANLSLLGYDPRLFYSGRGPIEAASNGIIVPRGWTAFRCNLVSTDGERMLDYSAGHISDDEANEIVGILSRKLGDSRTKFYHGKSYRQLLLLEGDYTGVVCTPPHDITGQSILDHLPKGENSARLIELIESSREVLSRLDLNSRRRKEGKLVVDLIWPWGQGSAMELEPFPKRFGLSGYCISAVDLIRGLARLAGLEFIDVPGATGYLDTNYKGKGDAALCALESGDFVFVHVEAPDEASHEGLTEEKVKAIERFDKYIVGPVLQFGEKYVNLRIFICPDHPTFISTRTHDSSPVPYALFGPGIQSSDHALFSEEEARNRGPHFDEGWMVMHYLTGREAWPQI